ncbi:TRAP transporter small permease [Kiloniella laminariae]|uniref:TRAP transporter small permease n=1 Tax=Kiloniella laminariae TaxID=454162 RepID=UPI00037691C9|nr:TRAP transporter small permease [Kiloniella laminariae]
MGADSSLRQAAARLSDGLNWFIERVVAAIMLLMVFDVWLGVLDRYGFHWQLPWPEELARYLMIWAALLAISCGIARREHIGLTILLDRLPSALRAPILMVMDLVSLLIFAYIAWYGIDFAQAGAKRQAMIFGMTLALPFAAVPVSAAIACLQQVLVAIRDMGKYSATGSTEEVK